MTAQSTYHGRTAPIASAYCATCKTRQLARHEHDGYDDWRERLFLAGISIPEVSAFDLLAIVQALTGSDAIAAYIELHIIIHMDGKATSK